MTTRRTILTGATALAAGAILPAGASTVTHPDAALLAVAASLRALLARYAVLEEEAHRTYRLVAADPEWPLPHMPFHAALNNRLYVRHGYLAASNAWNDATIEARDALDDLRQTRPETVDGAAAKARVLCTAADHHDLICPDDIIEHAIAPIVADLVRLAAKA